MLYKQVDDRLGQANVQRGLGELESKLGATRRRARPMAKR